MINNRINISSNSPWEEKVGYSRAVRVNNLIFVSGTTALENNHIVGVDDPYTQTIQCIKNMESALINAKAELSNIVRLRIYVVNINDWEIIGKALNQYFIDIKPAATMVEVQRLITPEVLVEIEADAYIN